MSVAPKGPGDYDLHRATPEQFETLTFLLAHAEHAAAVVVRNKDHGLDARLPDATGRLTLRGWQAKRFERGKIHWGQCDDSVRRALAFWRPLAITFVFAHDLSAAEQRAFETNLIQAFPEVRLTFWSEIEVQRRLRDSEEGRNAAKWLYGNAGTLEELLAALITKEPVRSAAEIAARQAALQRRFDEDPHLFYTTVTRNPKAGETPPASGTVASLSMLIDGQEVRYDLSERYPGAMKDLGGGPILVTSNDEAGRRARETVQGIGFDTKPLEISSGLGVMWPEVPVGLRGLVPETPLWGRMQVETSPAAPSDPAVRAGSAEAAGLSVLARAGNASLGLVFLHAETLVEGVDGTLVAATGGLEIMYSYRSDGSAAQAGMDWRHTLGVGTGLEQLLSCRLLIAAIQGHPFELYHASRPDVTMISATLDERLDGADGLSQLRQHEQFLSYVCELQAWLGQPLYPPARPTQNDADELGRAISLIRSPERRGSWREVTLAVAVPATHRFVQAAILEPVWITLFDTPIYLGLDFLVLIAAEIVESDAGEVRLVPADEDAQLVATLNHRDGAPIEMASSPYGSGYGRVLIRPLTVEDSGESEQDDDTPGTPLFPG